MTLQTALELARNGYYVHPLCWPTPDGHCGCGRNHTDSEAGKAPLVAGGNTAATCDEATIRAWWTQWPQANIGVDLEQTGLLDIAPDCSAWAATFKANGMAPTVLYTSGSCWHALYRRPSRIRSHEQRQCGCPWQHASERTTLHAQDTPPTSCRATRSAGLGCSDATRCRARPRR
jgi:hypothetical protein